MEQAFLDKSGIKAKNLPYKIMTDAPSSVLVGDCIRFFGGKLTNSRALVVETGKHTGRSAKDKYVVKSDSTKESIWWDNSIHAMTPQTFEGLKDRILNYLNGDRNLYAFLVVFYEWPFV